MLHDEVFMDQPLRFEDPKSPMLFVSYTRHFMVLNKYHMLGLRN